MFAGLVVLWFVDGRIKKEQVLHALFACFVAFTVTEIIKQLFHIPRPFIVDGLRNYTLTTPLDSTFPSSHSAVVFALALTVWFHDRKIGFLFLFLAAIVAWARVAANVHYPIDVFFGGVIGSLVALIIEKIHLRY